MPNRNLNKIVCKIDGGTIFYKLYSPPQKIVDDGGRWRLKPPQYELKKNETLIAMGYRHCPSYWEWVLLLKNYKGEPWLIAVERQFAEGKRVTELSLITQSPVITIVREPNDWTNKGGVPEQISVYLASDIWEFQWTPSVAQLTVQLCLAFGLYGWGGPEGLKSEIFDRI